MTRAGTLLAVLVGLAAASPLPAQELSADQVNRAISRGVAFLKQRQLPDGTWPNFRQPGGMTALATLALLTANTPLDDPTLAAGLAATAQLPLNENSLVYVVSLQATALAQADPQRYAPVIARAAQWLRSAQGEDGLWTYGLAAHTGGVSDHSNSQFALMGLYEAARAGAQVPASVWARAEAALLAHQCRDGGWAYTTAQEHGYGSMTAGCLASLFLTGHQRAVSAEQGYDEATGAVPGCGQYQDSPAITRGLAWLGRHFDAARNPGFARAADIWTFYWLYAVERLGVVAGLRRFGPHDWYAAGAARLVNDQRDNGSWGTDDDTCLALLFLAKGRAPLIIQKLAWSDAPDQPWNVHRFDLQKLTTAVGRRINDRPVAWQSVDLEAPLEAWLAAPILFIQGRQFPALGDAARAKLRDYVDRGGTILAEATCTSAAFDQGFRAFCRQTFPGSTLTPLPLTDPLFQRPHRLADTWKIEALQVGCRTGVVYLPKDLTSLLDRGNVPRLSPMAFQLGENLLHYLAGGEVLPDRLTARPAGGPPPAPPEQRPRGAVQIGQVVYKGPWNPHPEAMPALARFLHDQAGVDVIAQPLAVELTDAALAPVPIVYLTGHLPFEFSPAEAAALRRHLERGGFLLAAPCCGHEAFNVAFKAQLAAALPGSRLVVLPADHAIRNGSLGFDLSRVTYKTAVQADQPQLAEPVLEGIEWQGRLVGVFTPFDLGGGILGHAFGGCRGYTSESARAVAASIVLYALSH